MIDNSLDHLAEPFRTKAKVFLACIRTRYPNVAPFETLRSWKRQVWLVATRKSRTYNSYHLKGLACDWVFLNKWGVPTRKWDYYFLQWIAAMCGMRRIKQELCHTEDNWNRPLTQMALNSKRYHETTDIWERYWLHMINNEFRKYQK